MGDDHPKGVDGIARPGYVADPPAGHGIALGDAVEGERAVPQARPVALELDGELRDLSEPERREWTRWFMWFLRRVALRQGKRLVLKTPQHTARLSTLIELFPDARFVHLARNPFDLLPSTVRLWRSMTSIQGLENPPHDEDWVEESVLANFTRMFECYDEDRALIPEGQLLEIAYEDLVAAPKETLRTIYERLDLGDFARTEPAVDAYLAKVRDYKPNTYVLPADKRALVLERWGPYIDRFGYRPKTG